MPIRYVSVSRFSAMKANALQTVAMCNAFAEKEETFLYFFDDGPSHWRRWLIGLSRRRGKL